MNFISRIQKSFKTNPEDTPNELRDIRIENGVTTETSHTTSNKIRTSKYRFYNFVLYNIFEQLLRPANAYFVIIAILQSIPEVSISQGKPSILLPLLFVLTISMIKDGFEDQKRHLQDNLENNRVFNIYNVETGQMENRLSKDIKVGDLIEVHDNQSFPADLLLLMCFDPSTAKYCYVETSNLDGETNLKIKQTIMPTSHIMSREELKNLSMKIEYQMPNPQLDNFSAKITDSRGNLSHPRIDHLLLRGSLLKNSTNILGLVIYTGSESKIFKNLNARSIYGVKRSSVERKMNKLILFMGSFQVAVCIFSAIYNGVQQKSHNNDQYNSMGVSPSLNAFYRFFTQFIIFAQFVPISLLVSMEVVKFIQAKFMQQDKSMSARNHVTGEIMPCDVQSSGLNEDLGQIQYIFSDKTGTLTRNSLDFRKCIIGNKSYGHGETEISRAAARKRAAEEVLKAQQEGISDAEITDFIAEETARSIDYPHVNFDEKQIIESLLECDEFYRGDSKLKKEQQYISDGKLEQARNVRLFLTSLAINNSCFPEMKKRCVRCKTIFDDHQITLCKKCNGELEDFLSMKASSPDDEALVCFSNYMGIEFYEVKPPKIRLRISHSSVNENYFEEYEQLALFDFSSKRKRMTAIVKYENSVYVFMKGADSSCIPLLPGFDSDIYASQPNQKFTEQRLEYFAEQGLRTLLVCCSVLPIDQQEGESGYSIKYNNALKEIVNEGPDEKGHYKGICTDFCRRCKIETEIEKAANMNILGATAIEDRLQDHVPQTIESLLDGGIRVQVLTGDKLETAINIGIACSILDHHIEKENRLLKLTGETLEEVEDQLDEFHKRIFNINSEDQTDEKSVAGNLVAKTKDELDINNNETKTNEIFSVIITSKALSLVSSSEYLEAKFCKLAFKCKSVVACRMQPDQKALIVRMVKKYEKSVCLSIGDGANDEPMIRSADVGVGIYGIEGTAAVRASDYAIGEFCFLRRLLFVHGSLSYKRISDLICYIFYKNILLCLTVFWFGFANGFSGQPLQLEWAFQLYNVSFTALPILVYALLDRQLRLDSLQKYTHLYKTRLNGKLFNLRRFLLQIGDSILHSIILSLITWFSYSNLASDDNNDPRSFGIQSVGLVLYSAVVITANLRISFVFNSWTQIHQFVIQGSIVFFFIAMSILSSSTAFATAGSDYFNLIFRLMSSYRYQFTVIVLVFFALLIDVSFVGFQLEQSPSPYDLFRETDRMRRKKGSDQNLISTSIKIDQELSTIKNIKNKKIKSVDETTVESVKKLNETFSKQIIPDFNRSNTGFVYSGTGGNAQTYQKPRKSEYLQNNK